MRAVGDPAPAIDGVAFGDGPVALFFYKVTCPVCRLAAPTMAPLHAAMPGRVIGVGQDPVPALDRFARETGMGIASVEDPPPYAASRDYDVGSVPTLVLVDDAGRIADVVGAWDRDGFNRVAAALSTALDVAPVVVSTPGDGLPAFKPG